MRRLFVLLATAALGFAGLVAAQAATSMMVTPWTYYRGQTFGEGVHGTAVSQCSAAGLHLAKTEATSGDSSAGATIGGVSGHTLSGLGLDVLTGSHFSGGAPRFNVRTGTGDNDIHFYGAAAATAVSGAPAGYQRYTFDLTKDGAGNGGTGDKELTSINIVFDEQGGATIKNIVVNDNTLNCTVAVVATATPTPTPTASTRTLARTGGGGDGSSPSPLVLLLAGLVLLGGGALAFRRR